MSEKTKADHKTNADDTPENAGKAKAERSEHKLLKPHRHANINLVPGESVKLLPRQVQQLRSEQKIK